MKFDITIMSDQASEQKVQLIVLISQSLKIFLSQENYGNDLKALNINLICMKSSAGSDYFFKTKKPSYIDYKEKKNIFTGETIIFNKHFNYDIKFDDLKYDAFLSSSDDESLKLLGREIVDSFNTLNQLPKKVKDFDINKFKIDIENYLKSKNWI